MPESPPSFVVRLRNAPGQWRLWAAIGGAWLVSLILVGVVAANLGARHQAAGDGSGNRSALAAQNLELQSRVAILDSASRVDKAALEDLQQTLRDREEEIDGLRSDLAFYGRLVGGPSRQGLAVHDIRLTPVANSRAWDFVVTLTQTLRQGADAKGRVSISVDVMQDGKLASLAWKTLCQGQNPSGVAYGFKYFQRLHGTIMLPEGFVANRVHVLADGDGGRAERDFLWADAAKTGENVDVRS